MNAPTLADKQWLDSVIAAGMPVVDGDGVLHDGKDVAERAAAQARVDAGRSDELPAIIPIGPTHSAHTIVVTDLHNHTHDLRLELTWGALDDLEWYKHQINKVELQMLETDDRNMARDLATRLRALRHERLRLYAPDLTDGLLEYLDPSQVEIIEAAIIRMEADGTDAVNAKKKEWWEPVQARRPKKDESH